MAIILHVVNTYFAVPYFIGGQFQYFKNKGHDLHLICSKSQYLDQYSQEMEFTYKTVEITRNYSIIKDLFALLTILKYIKKYKIDIIVGHTPKGALLAMSAGKLLKVPKRIFFRHGLVYETAKGLNRKVLILAEKITSLCSTQIICVSPSIFELSVKDHLNSKTKQFLLGKGTCGGIDTITKFNPELLDIKDLSGLRNKFQIKEKDVVIGFCGRLVKDKGIVELISGFELLQSKYKRQRFVLLLVGMFESRDQLPVEIINKIRSDDNIIYTGFINHNIQYYYGLMTIYILPSYREGFGMSAIEASAMEIPVLTSKSTGCIDSIIENVTGRYVEISPCAITSGVEYYLENPEVAKNHGINGREFVKNNFDNLIIWKELEQFYY